MHRHFTALYDACVLYPATLRNLLIQLARTGLYRARWTEQIHDEWSRSLLRDKPDIGHAKLAMLREQINDAVPDCLITGYEPRIQTLQLPDPDDRHVLAAAIHAHAQVIITTNLRHFPDDALQPHAITAQHPDRFVLRLLDLDPNATIEAFRLVRQRLRKPPYDPAAFLDLVEQSGLPASAQAIRDQQSILER
jgi:predicted nucleic acid-binding protein